MVILYIMAAVFMQLIGAVTRSFFGPLIIVENSDLPLPKFAENYRLLVFSIADFMVGVALLYLFYNQGMLAVRRVDVQKRQIQSLKKFKDLS